MEQDEIWKDVVSYEGKYMVSNKGRVKSLNTIVEFPYNRGGLRIFRGQIRKLRLNGSGYLQLNLSKSSKKKGHLVHRLVASSFIPNPEGKAEVNHLDYNPLNNNVENLNWMTRQENITYSHERIRAAMFRNFAISHSGNSPCNRPVIKLDMDGKFIREYKSIREATVDVGGTKKSYLIGFHIKNPVKRPHAYGYTWKLKTA